MKTELNLPPASSTKTPLPVEKVKSSNPSPIPGPVAPSKEDYRVELSAEAREPQVSVVPLPVKVEKVVGEKQGNSKRPAIVFIPGWQGMLSPSSSEGSYAGITRMAETIEGARVYGWDQKSEILEYIKKTHVNQPVILVGHSLGADTAKEVADDLDSLEHGFRGVDLLVTLDAVGFDNKVISQNVKRHMNIFGENNSWLNDGPHVARNHARTKIENILSSLDHTELDDAKDTQFQVIEAVHRALGKGTLDKKA